MLDYKLRGYSESHYFLYSGFPHNSDLLLDNEGLVECEVGELELGDDY